MCALYFYYGNIQKRFICLVFVRATKRFSLIVCVGVICGAALGMLVLFVENLFECSSDMSSRTA